MVSQFAAHIRESEDVIPAVEPVKLSAERTGADGAENGMPDFRLKAGIEYEQRTLLLNNPGWPTSMGRAIKFEGSDFYRRLTFGHSCASLPETGLDPSQSTDD